MPGLETEIGKNRGGKPRGQPTPKGGKRMSEGLGPGQSAGCSGQIKKNIGDFRQKGVRAAEPATEAGGETVISLLWDRLLHPCTGALLGIFLSFFSQELHGLFHLPSAKVTPQDREGDRKDLDTFGLSHSCAHGCP